ncbi:hypothetical protein HELRODRAFT_166217 [Helobdella robusta]|uniref:Uncharacterized protein n=1 Tax=Helobdella robusta TaxID=6412 RepID=T1EXX0_HELRO|nr:hypothetical protein HELRODRAFT_166217 [Helobdella robusta]ESN90542.1 hypothetical protein HELRODRAFT_166217 [Helobdella robusta]
MICRDLWVRIILVTSCSFCESILISNSKTTSKFQKGVYPDSFQNSVNKSSEFSNKSTPPAGYVECNLSNSTSQSSFLPSRSLRAVSGVDNIGTVVSGDDNLTATFNQNSFANTSLHDFNSYFSPNELNKNGSTTDSKDDTTLLNTNNTDRALPIDYYNYLLHYLNGTGHLLTDDVDRLVSATDADQSEIEFPYYDHPPASERNNDTDISIIMNDTDRSIFGYKYIDPTTIDVEGRNSVEMLNDTLNGIDQSTVFVNDIHDILHFYHYYTDVNGTDVLTLDSDQSEIEFYDATSTNNFSDTGPTELNVNDTYYADNSTIVQSKYHLNGTNQSIYDLNDTDKTTFDYNDTNQSIYHLNHTNKSIYDFNVTDRPIYDYNDTQKSIFNDTNQSIFHFKHTDQSTKFTFTTKGRLTKSTVAGKPRPLVNDYHQKLWDQLNNGIPLTTNEYEYSIGENRKSDVLPTDSLIYSESLSFAYRPNVTNILWQIFLVEIIIFIMK